MRKIIQKNFNTFKRGFMGLIDVLIFIAIAMVVYNLFFKISNMFYYIICSFLIISIGIFVIYIIENTVFQESEPIIERKKNLFNIFYINFSKVFEISMLINNQLTTNVERTTKNEQIVQDKQSIKGGLISDIASVSVETNYDIKNSKSDAYKETIEVKNTNAKFLSPIYDNSKEIDNFDNIKEGQLVKIKNVMFEIDNIDEILQVNSMISGALNGNTMSADANGQELKININALANVLLKDYCYQLKCYVNDNPFFINIPMSIDKEFENRYSIYDLEIGTMTVIGIFKSNKYDNSKHSTWSRLQNVESKENIITDDIKQSNTSFKKNKIENNHNKENLEIPYIDLIAIIQNIDFDNVEEGSQDE